MNVNRFLIFVFVILQMASPVFAATVYKWIDGDGQIHYESKPQHKNAKKLKLKDRYIDSDNKAVKSNLDEDKQKKDDIDSEHKSINEVKIIKQEQKELKITRCHAAKAQLQRAINSKALYDLDEKDNRILLRKKQYVLAMKQARARVKKWCH